MTTLRDLIDRIPAARPPEDHWSPFGTVEADVLVRCPDGVGVIVEVFEDLGSWERSLSSVRDVVAHRAGIHGTPVRVLVERIRWDGPSDGERS